jgi:hypothetical protein
MYDSRQADNTSTASDDGWFYDRPIGEWTSNPSYLAFVLAWTIYLILLAAMIGLHRKNIAMWILFYWLTIQGYIDPISMAIIRGDSRYLKNFEFYYPPLGVMFGALGARFVGNCACRCLNRTERKAIEREAMLQEELEDGTAVSHEMTLRPNETQQADGVEQTDPVRQGVNN